MEQLLTTKFYIPTPRPELVSRPRLIRQLNDGLHRKLTLISAPAGFGKTSLISEWIDGLEKGDAQRRQASYCITWLSLDDNDNDLVRFLTYFIVALNQIEGINLPLEESLGMLQSSQPQSIETLFTHIINEIAAFPEKMIFVLDDYHLIETRSIHAALTFLLDNLPPQLHLVIATREDPPVPLARLRARGQLSELRVAVLRFTTKEAADFFNLVMGLDLSKDDIAALESRTEGWIAGLQLAALSLRDREDVHGFIKTFAGDNRYIGDYLVEEVIQRQPKSVRSFLLQTSILKRLNGALCDAITDQKNSAALLNSFVRENLFVLPLDDKNHWFRYHQLFADVLQAYLLAEQPDQVPILHGRASEWHEKHGDMPEAFQHAIAAGDFNLAANLAEMAWQGMDENMQSAAWLTWTRQLPEDVIRVRPVLCTQIAWSFTDTGQLEASDARLQDAEKCLSGAADEQIFVEAAQFQALPARIAFARAYNSQITGAPAATVKYAEEALELVPEDDLFLQAQIKVVLGSAYWTSGQLDAAAQAMREWIESTQQAGNFVFAIASGFGLADILFAQGQLREAKNTIEQSLRLAGEHAEAQSIIANHYLGLALLFHEIGDDETANENLETGVNLAAQSTLIDTAYRLHIVQACLKESNGELEAALDLLDEAQKAYVETPIPNTRPVEALKARIYLKQGARDKAWDWVQARGLSVNDEISYLHEFELLTLARVLIAEFQSTKEERYISDALDLLERLLNAAEAAKRNGSVIEILITQSLAYEAQDNVTSALDPLNRALKLAAPEGYLRIFVDEGAPMARLLYQTLSDGMETGHVRQLLGAFPETEPAKTGSPKGQPDLIEPLSERELEVLQQIAEGLTNQEVADRLFISLHTVKIHARNIYAKLGVKNRTQAVKKGQDVGILST